MIPTYYLVAGGPSLLGYDWNLLKFKRVIAINRSFREIPWAEYIYFTDWKFFNEYQHKGLLQARGELISIDKKIDHPRVTIYENTGANGLDMNKGCLRHGKNSGYAAINLAVQLGARRIVLMGYDMKIEQVEVTRIEDGKKIFVPGRTHWHEGSAIKPTMRVYDKMLPHFSTLAKPLKELGVEVLNASKHSRIDVFPKFPLEQAHMADMLGAI